MNYPRLADLRTRRGQQIVEVKILHNYLPNLFSWPPKIMILGDLSDGEGELS